MSYALGVVSGLRRHTEMSESESRRAVEGYMEEDSIVGGWSVGSGDGRRVRCFCCLRA